MLMELEMIGHNQSGGALELTPLLVEVKVEKKFSNIWYTLHNWNDSLV
jgi:hypothetical protein